MTLRSVGRAFKHDTNIFRDLYPWTTRDQFLCHIKDNIIYRSEDNGSLVAIHKPFGVGINLVQDNNTTKQNQDRLLSRIRGTPKFCIADILQPLSDDLDLKNPLQVISSIDRYCSGIILLSDGTQEAKRRVQKCFDRARCSKEPHYGFRAITYGYPIVPNNYLAEKVGMKLLETDPLGDYKEPVIVTNPSNMYSVTRTRDRAVSRVELKVLKINKELSASLVELFTSSLKWDFPRCYISSKTSFILGDVRFSKRIKEILGKPTQISALNTSHNFDENYGRLNTKISDRLGVNNNAYIPLMLDCFALRLKGFDRSDGKDLLIQSPYVPVHFAHTLERLDLLEL